jgi:hypothetical protein
MPIQKKRFARFLAIKVIGLSRCIGLSRRTALWGAGVAAVAVAVTAVAAFPHLPRCRHAFYCGSVLLVLLRIAQSCSHILSFTAALMPLSTALYCRACSILLVLLNAGLDSATLVATITHQIRCAGCCAPRSRAWGYTLIYWLSLLSLACGWKGPTTWI